MGDVEKNGETFLLHLFVIAQRANSIHMERVANVLGNLIWTYLLTWGNLLGFRL